MTDQAQTRWWKQAAYRTVLGTAGLLCIPAAQGLPLAHGPQQAPAPIERRTPTPRTGATAAQHHGPRGEHLAEWMSQHSTLSPDQQRRALELEPGFRDLPQQTQQRMRERLSQLNAMPPGQRQRLLARNEAMERLRPEQRAEVRSVMGQLGTLPEDQRRDVAHTFRALRDLPSEQRMSAYASGRYGPPLNDAQRGVLFNLLRVEPLLPSPEGHQTVP